MTVCELSTAPGLAPLYAAAVAGAVAGRRPEQTPDTELVLPGVAVDVDHLAGYNRICGFRLADALPLTYPHVLAFPLALALMTRRDFPFPLPGLVHVGNRIEAFGPLRTGDRLTLRVRATALLPHPRGRQLDVVTEAHVDGACAWREHSTYLRRERTAARPADGPTAAPAGAGGAVWPVDARTAARYARISGDRNPIHTSRLAARAFGFPRRIAHGMWTVARCLAALEGRLPDRMVADVRFHQPVLLPTRVAFRAVEADRSWTLTVADRKTSSPKLTGTVAPLPEVS